MAFTDWKRCGIRGQDTVDHVAWDAAIVCIGTDTTGAPNTWDINDTLLGATTNGVNIAITPKFASITVDGVGQTPVKGLTNIPNGMTAEVTANLTEINDKYLEKSIVGDKNATKAETDTAWVKETSMDIYTPRKYMKAGDYTTIVVVAFNVSGDPVAIFAGKDALCTSGLNINTAPSKNNPVTVKFALHTPLDGDLRTLDYALWVPTSPLG